MKTDADTETETRTPLPQPQAKSEQVEPTSEPTRPASFAEEALRLGGKGAEEVRRMGAVDTADDQVEALFADKYRTNASPIHQAVWDAKVNGELWNLIPQAASAEAETVM